VDSTAAAAVVTASPPKPRLAGLGSMVVSMKFAVVNFPPVDFTAAVAEVRDAAGSVDGGDLYPETGSLDVTGAFCTGFFFSLV